MRKIPSLDELQKWTADRLMRRYLELSESIIADVIERSRLLVALENKGECDIPDNLDGSRSVMRLIGLGAVVEDAARYFLTNKCWFIPLMSKMDPSLQRTLLQRDYMVEVAVPAGDGSYARSRRRFDTLDKPTWNQVFDGGRMRTFPEQETYLMQQICLRPPAPLPVAHPTYELRGNRIVTTGPCEIVVTKALIRTLTEKLERHRSRAAA